MRARPPTSPGAWLVNARSAFELTRVFGDQAGHHRAAMLGMHRRRARVGDDFEMLAHAAGVHGDKLLARRRALLRRARVSGALGDGPPIYVGASQALRRRQLLSRLLRGD